MSNISNLISIISGFKANLEQLETIVAAMNTPTTPKAVANAPATPGAPEKKQRGRPKKMIDIVIPAQPNFDEPSTPQNTTEKRGRGRPKGSPNKSKTDDVQSTTENESAMPTPVSSPPTMQSSEKRGRGRPKGSHNKSKESDSDSCTSEQAQPVPPTGLEADKRGRGRPKGSHNKPKEDTPVA